MLVGSQSIRASEQRGLFFFPFSCFYFGNPAFTIGIGDDQVGIGGQLFIAASDNDKGVLILSHFTGAARELEQALMVNPYDTESFMESIHQALVMSPEEQKTRMERMRITVAENNIYTWAQAILNDVVRLAEDSQIGSGSGS